ncbi:Putative uncharacterized protein [Moritella viscosa]|nr:Putative uncharacterized protein [Moritella viscosa]
MTKQKLEVFFNLYLRYRGARVCSTTELGIGFDTYYYQLI